MQMTAVALAALFERESRIARKGGSTIRGRNIIWSANNLADSILQ